MALTNNYLIQAQQAKNRFATYDQEKLIAKLQLHHDEAYLYPTLFSEPYRIHRETGDIDRKTEEGWVDANSFGEVMVLLDLVCDSRKDRFVTGRWKNMTDFGLMFHKNLMEGKADPFAEKFQADPQGFRKACEMLKGVPFPQGDIAYTLEVFDGLCLTLQLWFGDEDFPAGLRFLWDENALMYIKYETMHFAKGLLLEKLGQLQTKTSSQ